MDYLLCRPLYSSCIFASFTSGQGPFAATLQMASSWRLINILAGADRFREEVRQDLLERKVDVQELYQPLSSSMRDIQDSIIECMDSTLSEIKRSNASVRSLVTIACQHSTDAFSGLRFSSQLDVEDLNVENALFRSFDMIVRAQLDSVWHKVGPRTKGLVADLTTLRKLQLCVSPFSPALQLYVSLTNRSDQSDTEPYSITTASHSTDFSKPSSAPTRRIKPQVAPRPITVHGS